MVSTTQDAASPPTADAPLPAKTCGCTGVRWCAECRAPERRAAWKLRAPIETPAFLRARPVEPGRTACGSTVHGFDVEAQCVPDLPSFSGVWLLRDFVSEAEAETLLAEIEAAPFAPAQSGKQKQHFGAKANFRKRRLNVSHFEGLPGYGRWLEARLRTRLAEAGEQPAGLAEALVRYVTTDVFVLRYLERQCSNLDVHIDDTWAYGEVILDLSLESDGWMTFLDRDPQDGVPGGFTCVRVPMPERSLAVLFGPARFGWHHGIAAADIHGRRTSITLRTLGEGLRNGPEGRAVLERATLTCA
jgi:alkylated DNA repair protein alkB family protein 4